MKTFEANVKVANSSGTMVVKTRVQAEDHFRAKLLLEQQYGKGNVVGGVLEVR